MAHLIRAPKQGNDWTQSDLEAYNVKVVFQDAITFFNGPLPQPTVRPEILTAQNPADDTLNHNTRAFIEYLNRTPPFPEEDSFDFLQKLFQELKYEESKTDLRLDYEYLVCGELKPVKTDFCLKSVSTSLVQLFVQEDKRYAGFPGPEAQLIPGAIGIYLINSLTRAFSRRGRVEEELLLGVTLTGTFPIFYKIPITAALGRAVRNGQYPPEETVLYAHRPEVPRPQQCFTEGMVPLDNRYIIFSCFEAFKQFLP